MTDRISELAGQILDAYKKAGKKIVTAESCTGGLVAGAITEIAGSSAVFERGYVTYSNGAKREVLTVPSNHFQPDGCGSVAEETARAMAEGALSRSHAAVSVAVTGVAGPGGGSSQKPVGLVYFASSVMDGETLAEHHVFEGGRAAIRRAAVIRALEILLERA